jgi:hypothetical protein
LIAERASPSKSRPLVLLCERLASATLSRDAQWRPDGRDRFPWKRPDGGVSIGSQDKAGQPPYELPIHHSDQEPVDELLSALAGDDESGGATVHPNDQGSGGERTIERLLSVDQICRLQRRSLYPYLSDALSAKARADPSRSSPETREIRRRGASQRRTRRLTGLRRPETVPGSETLEEAKCPTRSSGSSTVSTATTTRR